MQRHAKGCQCRNCSPMSHPPNVAGLPKWMHPKDCDCTWCISDEKLMKLIAECK